MPEPTTTEFAHRSANGHDRSLASVIAATKEEAKNFLNTRVQLIKAEVRETMGAVKVALPLSLIAIALFCAAFLLFTAAAVVLVVSAFAGNPYAWLFALLIIGVIWAAGGAVAAFFAYNSLRTSHFPRRTVEVLKADKLWLQTEARSHS